MNNYPLYHPARPEPVCGPYMGPTPCEEMFCEGEHFPHKHGCKPEPATALPLGHNPCIPQIKPVPPVPSPIEGSSLYEQMGALTQRVNVCINQWNEISKNCYEALNQVVNAARSNDVYYDDCEVHYQEGYDEIEGATYAIVEKKAVDRKNEPIFVRLMPAYGNTSNPGVRQKIFDASFITSANVIITAVQSTDDTWKGPALKGGAGIPGTQQESGYVYGFTRRGALRYFPYDVTETTLCQQGMVDVIGGCVPILYDGQLVEGVDTMTSKEAVTAIGFNSGTGSVFFFACSSQNSPGMGLAGVARVLQGYGCTVAVVTSHQVNSPECTVSEGMLYMGQMTMDPVQALQPDNVAYWVVSKQPCFRNRFQKEVADLVQTTGRNAWENYLLGVQIQSFDDRILNNTNAIKAEQDRAMQAEQWLQENINKEVNRAMQAEEWLQENINKEVDRATEAEVHIREDINKEMDRAMAAERELRDKLLQEVADRIEGDRQFLQQIEKETIARQEADADLLNRINQVQSNLDQYRADTDQQISDLRTGAVELPYLKLTGGSMAGNINMTGATTVVLGRGPVEQMEAATKKYVDDAISSAGPGGDVTKEYVDNQDALIREQIRDGTGVLETKIDGKVSKTGDSMSGALNMGGNQVVNPVLATDSKIRVIGSGGGDGYITGLDDPTASTDAANRRYVDKEVLGAKTYADTKISGLSDQYLPLSGGTMSGDITMSGTSAIKTEGQPLDIVSGGLVLLDESRQPVNVEGVAEIIMNPNNINMNGIVLGENATTIRSETLNVGSAGTITGDVGCGGVTLYTDENSVHSKFSKSDKALVLGIGGSTGVLYVNNLNTTGGTGTIYAGRYASPNVLTLEGQSINVGDVNINNLKNAERDQDAATYYQVLARGNGLVKVDADTHQIIVRPVNGDDRIIKCSLKAGNNVLEDDAWSLGFFRNSLYIVINNNTAANVPLTLQLEPNSSLYCYEYTVTSTSYPGGTTVFASKRYGVTGDVGEFYTSFTLMDNMGAKSDLIVCTLTIENIFAASGPIYNALRVNEIPMVLNIE